MIFSVRFLFAIPSSSPSLLAFILEKLSILARKAKRPSFFGFIQENPVF
jgi:hypothetical protein